tara:strand:- start:15965 stop:16246 length:282 start_codon:yes stop_codon:yes gene_type:complete
MDNNEEKTKGYRVEVQTERDGSFTGNALTFRTFSGAQAYGADLAARWTLVIDWHVLPVAATPSAIGENATIDWAEETGATRPHADAPAVRVKL